MEQWKGSGVTVAGIVMWGSKWRGQPAGVYCARLTFIPKNSPAVNSIGAAPPWTSL